MLSALLLMTLVLSVSVGNLALGYGLALHLGQGPKEGWQALCLWKRGSTKPAADHVPEDHGQPAAAEEKSAH